MTGRPTPLTKYRCPNCGHWCVPVDDDVWDEAWICNKRGGCGSEWTWMNDPVLDAAPAGWRGIE